MLNSLAKNYKFKLVPNIIFCQKLSKLTKKKFLLRMDFLFSLNLSNSHFVFKQKNKAVCIKEINLL